MDYLLTDRDWTTTNTTPTTWTRNGWDTHDPTGLQALGHALVTATVPATGDTASLRILESLVRETGNTENLHDTHITDTNLINPHLRLPIAHILGAHITEIHRAFGFSSAITLDGKDCNKYLPGIQEEDLLDAGDVTRVLADLARNPDAADYLTRQDAAFTAALYHEYIANGGIVDHAFTSNAKVAIEEASTRSGRVLGALQIGDALHRDAEITDQTQKEKQREQAFDNAKTFIQSLVNVGITAGTIAHPVAGETTRGIASILINSVQNPQENDHTARAAYDTIKALHEGDSAARGILEQAIFLNALTEINKDNIFTRHSGELIPAEQWDEDARRAWGYYKSQLHGYDGGLNTASTAFLTGTKMAENELGVTVNSSDGSTQCTH
jgi:hypothetical protein